MWILRLLFFGSLVAMFAAAVMLPEDPEKARILDQIGLGVFASFGLMLIFGLLRMFRPRKRAPKVVKSTARPIVVDGSNVMHWGGDPSLMVLNMVLKELQNKGFAPHVFFDANVGYKLFNEHMNANELAQKIALPADQVTIVKSGTAADGVLLEHAIDDGLRVVTNDRFLEWKTKFPRVGEKGFLVKGVWKQGTVILLGIGGV